MAKGQKRSNREARKPKQPKLKVPAEVSSSLLAGAMKASQAQTADERARKR